MECRHTGLQSYQEEKWHFLTRLKSNRLMKSKGYCGKSLPVEKINIPLQGTMAYLRKYDCVKIFRKASEDGYPQYWATDVLDMDDTAKIKEYNRRRGIKSIIPVNTRKKKQKKSGRPIKVDQEEYKQKSSIERFFSWIESCKKVYPRYKVNEVPF